MQIEFTNISSIKFKIPKTINGQLYKHYDEVAALRMIYLKDIGYFQITSLSEQSDDLKEYKDCEALSAQVMFQSKRITNVVGEYKLYDPINPEKSLMGILLTLAPSWTLGTVDGIFLTRQRSINITEQDLYSMMTSDFYTAFEAIFVFDFNKYEINIYDALKEFKDTDIYIDSHNVLKNYQIESQADKIITALKVIGGDGLDISGVNPNGTDTIFNVRAFMDKMSTGLQNALKAYEVKFDSYKQQYSDLLVELKNKNTELNKLQSNAPQYDVSYTFNQDGTAQLTPTLTSDSGLAQLEGLRSNLENVRAVRIQNGNIPYTDVNRLISQVEPLIANKKTAISSMENQISNLSTQLSNITTQLKMENNFTAEQWIELNEYFRYDTVQENAFVITDIMSQDEKQQVRQELLEHGELILNKSCYPTYIFKISSVNFLALPEFAKFHDEFELGTTFTLRINDYYVVKPMLLGVKINFNDLSNFELIFGNKTNVNEGFDFSAYKNAVSAGASLSFDLVKIEALKSQQNDVANFINGSLIAATNKIKSTEDFTVATINEDGIRLQQYDFNTKAKQPYEAWLTGNLFAFSTDSFQTSNLAIGQIEAPGEIKGTVSGVIADSIIGRLVASNNLHVSNDKNNFTLDENGAFLNNANFVITKTQSGITNRIVLDPNEGFSIYKGADRQIYLDTNGDAIFRGHITGGSINIANAFTVTSDGTVSITKGNLNIGNRFVVTQAGNVTMQYAEINGGSIKLGNTTITESQLRAIGAYLDSTSIYDGRVNGSQVVANSITANHIQSNSISAGHIQSNTITSSHIQSGAVTANKISVNNLQAISADLGTINSGTINSITINAGTINGVTINGGTIRGGSYYNLDGTARMEVGNGSRADFTLYTGNSSKAFNILDTIDGISISAYGRYFLWSNGNVTRPQGTWNFSDASIIGIDSISDLQSELTNLRNRVSALERQL